MGRARRIQAERANLVRKMYFSDGYMADEIARKLECSLMSVVHSLRFARCKKPAPVKKSVARKAYCKRGHPLVEWNRQSGRIGSCKACKKLAEPEWVKTKQDADVPLWERHREMRLANEAFTAALHGARP